MYLMELKQLWAVVARRWWLIALPALVALLLTIPTIPQIISPPSGYAVTIRFTASHEPAGTPTSFQDQSYIPWLASEYAVNNLATWMKTESFAHEIVENVKAKGQTVDVNAVRGSIQSDSARSIMTFYMGWPDAAQLRELAQAAIEVLQTRSSAYFPQFEAAKANITAMDAVDVVLVAPALANRFSPLLRIALGLVAGLALAFLAEYLDPTIRSRSEVESIDLTVIGEIPN
jgi:capsular polysaccharide biosynthesis protein